ncbi:MAG TPA: hypothetical protein VES67_23470 [Vicinamibacterales bacterium]|nr:hypothetical protein [Vicinamibacterales bacterium]
MVPLVSLWMPILVSAVFVFSASFVIHMMLTYHRGDYRKLPEEAAVQDALRRFGIPPADYMLPSPSGLKDLRSPDFVERMTKGPVIFMTVLPSGRPGMAKNLVLWFLYCVVVGVFVAYITGRALPPGSSYLDVFRFAGTTAFMGYALALWQNTIWYKRAWTTTFKSTVDGLVYGMLTAGVFGWLWPAA